MGERWIVMLGTDFGTQGGIAAVVNAYRAGGLFGRWPVRYLPTHCDGGALPKLHLALANFARYIGLLATRRIAAVHVHAASRMSFWRKSPFLLLAFVGGRPVIFHLHGGGFREFYESDCGPLARAWIRGVLRQSACVIVLSSSWQAWVSSVAPKARLRVIPNPAPALQLRREKPVNDAPLLLFLGAINQEKGVFDLVQAVAGLRDPRLRLVLAGTGPALAAVRERAGELGIAAQLECPGWIDAPARDALLRDADILVLPSYYEGLPMSVLEAMAAGLAVIASRVGGIPEVIEHGIDGWLVAPGDVPAITGALASLLADATLRAAMGQAAQQKVARSFGPARILAQVEAVYREVAGPGLAGFENAKQKQRA
jgi:glycosyltransferase involved in cell wall biosynthesis